jgi:hypothetical protein
MLAGLGLYEGPWTNVAESISLTTAWQTFTMTQTTTGFGNDNSRILFDMGGPQGGQVWIDDVSVLGPAADEPVEPEETIIKVEAESYTNSPDVAKENGDTTVGYYDAGEVLEYTMTVATAGNYVAKYHVASPDGQDPGLNVTIAGTLADVVTVPATGGWGTFQTVTGRTITLAAGEQTLAVESVSGGVNVDWWSFTLTDAAASEAPPAPPTESLLGTGMDSNLDVDEVINFNSMVADYGLADFGGNTSTLVMDPTDATNTVVSVIKGSGSQTWAGTTIASGNVIYPLTATHTGITVRVWSPEAGITVRMKLEESGDNTHTVETDAVTTKTGEWETLLFDFSKPAADTAALNTSYIFDTLSLFFNFNVVGNNEEYYFDDITFIGPVALSVSSSSLVGTWKLAPVAGAFAVGPNPSDLSWYSSPVEAVTDRACLFDDTFVFAEGGGFSQDMGTDTWLETWQGVSSDACGTPIAPHDGSATDHTYAVVDGKGLATSTVTVTGLGAHLGLAKVYNGGELQAGEDVAATAGTTVAYNVTELSADGKSMTIQIQYVGVQTWQFKFAKQDEIAPTPDPTTGSVSITKVIETDAPDPRVKTVELYVSGTVDFANGDVVMNFQRNSGSFADIQIDISGLGTQTDAYVYVVRDLSMMQAEFPSANLSESNTVVVSDATSGDDAYQVVIDGTVATQFGETDVDGTDMAWEHTDSFAERITGTSEDGTFNQSHWTMQSLQYLDDYGTYNGAAALETVITLGNWIDTSTTAITVPVDVIGNGPDKCLDSTKVVDGVQCPANSTDDNPTIKGSYTSGDLTFVRPPIGSEAATADWCPAAVGACAARDTWRHGTNLYFRRMEHAKAKEWCESQNGRLATRQEITDHLVPTIPESEGGNGVWETQLYWPEQGHKYWTADFNGAGDKAFVFTTRNYGTGAAVYHLTNSEALTERYMWPMCVGG